jgi:phosphoribosylformylglycinamidine cyclo-ligase
VDTRLDELDGTVGDALLAVHRSYLGAIQALTTPDLAHAFVHVTGGGLPGNTPRVVGEGNSFEIDYDAWERPGLFRLIQRLGDVPESDMRATFNLGIGLVALVPQSRADEAERVWRAMGEAPVRIGRVTAAT